MRAVARDARAAAPGAGVGGDSVHDGGDILLFDTFPFNGDSIAELRLAVMAPYVDHIYVVEAWQPHAARADTQSARKPYLYSELPRWQAVWRQYGDKVLPVTPSLTRRAATTTACGESPARDRRDAHLGIGGDCDSMAVFTGDCDCGGRISTDAATVVAVLHENTSCEPHHVLHDIMVAGKR